ncbi:hypothetical protein JZ751_003203, partial [Albula glossodonta]
MEEERKIYEKVELERYVAYQQQHKDKPLKQGVAFQFVQALLAVNTRLQELDSNCKKLFNVILMSSNDTRVGLRLGNSIKKYGIKAVLPTNKEMASSSETRNKRTKRDPQQKGSADPAQDAVTIVISSSALFNTGNDKQSVKPGAAFPFLKALKLPMCAKPRLTDTHLWLNFYVFCSNPQDAVTIVITSSALFKKDNVQQSVKPGAAFPFVKGPFKSFLEALNQLQQKFKVKNKQGDCPIRTYLVTSRDGTTSGARVMKTLKSWGLQFDETHFLAGAPKGPVLEKICPHIFFDDQEKHTESAQEHSIIAAHVPYGIHN